MIGTVLSLVPSFWIIMGIFAKMRADKFRSKVRNAVNELSQWERKTTKEADMLTWIKNDNYRRMCLMRADMDDIEFMFAWWRDPTKMYRQDFLEQLFADYQKIPATERRGL